MEPRAAIHPGVSIDLETCSLGEFVVLGVPPRGVAPGSLPTRIGPHAVIRSHSVIYAGNVIGEHLETGHGVLIRESNEIGRRVSIGSHSIVEHHVTIGDDVRIHSNVFVPEFTVLEAGCAIGPCTVFTNTRYPWSAAAKDDMRGPHVEPGAIIGANVTVLPGVRIGARALIGAGAVVVKDVPPGAVLVGNPARVIGEIGDLAAYRSSGGSGEDG